MEIKLKYIFGNPKKFNLRYRIFHAVIFIGAFMNIIAAAGNYSLNLRPITYLFPIFSFVYFILVIVYSYKYRNFLVSYYLGFTFVVFIFAPVFWFINSGSIGGFQYFIFLFLIAIIAVSDDREKWIFSISLLLILISVLTIEYNFPEAVRKYPGKLDRFLDLIVSFTLSFVTIFAVTEYFMVLYKKANIKVKAQNNLLKQNNEEIREQKNQIIIQSEELKTTNRKLLDANKTKDKFLSIIAHNLKSPFHTMLGFSQILIEDFDDYNADEQKEYIGYIHKSTQNAYKLLENLLMWSQAKRGTIKFEQKVENLYLLSNNAIKPLAQSTTSKSIKIRNTTPKDIYVYADSNMLSTIIRNLISNAIKFTESGGDIIINAEKDKLGKEGNKIQISVTDTGVGISKEIQSKLFTMHENNSTKGTDDESGTGLGLILCKEFTEKHNCRIWVESEKDKGSKFIFTMPLA